LAAFVSFVQTYAVWILLGCGLGMLVALKMLLDAQRLSRTTLFSLEQERASEQTYRALIFIFVLVLAIIFVLFISLVVAPLVPPPGPVPVRSTSPTVAPIILPTQTAVPTATFTPVRRIEAPSPSVPISATVTRTTTRPPPPPPPLPSPTTVYLFPAPKIIGPLPNGGTWIGEGQANAAITFRWTCEQCALGPNDWYEVVITFTDRNGIPRTYAGRTRDTSLSLRRIYEGGGFELYQKAREDVFQWYVQVKREPGNQPVSPPSETWKFVWK
jgi:hypothetical protein